MNISNTTNVYYKINETINIIEEIDVGEINCCGSGEEIMEFLESTISQTHSKIKTLKEIYEKEYIYSQKKKKKRINFDFQKLFKLLDIADKWEGKLNCSCSAMDEMFEHVKEKCNIATNKIKEIEKWF